MVLVELTESSNKRDASSIVTDSLGSHMRLRGTAMSKFHGAAIAPGNSHPKQMEVEFSFC